MALSKREARGVSTLTAKKEEGGGKHGTHLLDCGWVDRWLARGKSDEGRRIWRVGGHHSRHSRWRRRRLGVRNARALAGRRHYWLDPRRVCWRRNSGVDHAAGEKGVACNERN